MCYDCFDNLIVDETIKKIVLEDGTIEYKDENGDLHNINDEPAVIHSDGTKFWCRKGFLHRDNDKPSIVEYNGSMFWYKNGLAHRDGDKPAIIFADGTEAYFKEGKVVK